MKHSRLRRLIYLLSGTSLAIVLFLMVFLFASAQQVAAQEDAEDSETGAVCVEDRTQKNTQCTANDVEVVALRFITSTGNCEGPGSTISATVELEVQANSPERYDIGLFIDQEGTFLGAQEPAAGELGCLHTYLAPEPPGSGTAGLVSSVAYEDLNSDGLANEYKGPPWLDTDSHQTPGDACGDVENNRTYFVEIPNVTLTCADTGSLDSKGDPVAIQDGQADVNVCASWSNNAPQDLCTELAQAIPGTGSKCSCTLLELPFTPTAVTLGDVSAESGSNFIVPLLAGLLLLSVATLLVYRQRRLASNAPPMVSGD
ncbi:MAG: hypothetical protein R3300_20635 [Candidatus Promineifilaceae bacterium]|nr:hypothetical protein [Candidatus Promineifilaceae bacterium]